MEYSEELFIISHKFLVLNQWLSKCGPWLRSVTWETERNVNRYPTPDLLNQALLQTD